MSRRDPLIALRQMRDHAREAIELVRNRPRRELDADRVFGLALVRLLEIVGEAAARVGEQQRERWPSIPWKPIVGLRNRLIHGYDEVDFDVVWSVVVTDLPALVRELEAVLTG